jgi:hypothetical protein
MVQKSSTWLTNGPTKTSSTGPSPNTAVGTFWAHFDTNRGKPSELHGSTRLKEPTVRLSMESSTSPGTATSSPCGRSTSVKRSTRPLHRSVTMPAMSTSRQRTQIYWKRCGFTRSNGKKNKFWGSQDCRSSPTRSRHNPKPVRRGPRPMLTPNSRRSQGRGCTSTLGGNGDGSRCVERRTIENAAAPPARTTTANPAISKGRLPRRCDRRAC